MHPRSSRDLRLVLHLPRLHRRRADPCLRKQPPRELALQNFQMHHRRRRALRYPRTVFEQVRATEPGASSVISRRMHQLRHYQRNAENLFCVQQRAELNTV